MRTLIGLPFSPWSEQARWALHHHRVPHRYEVYAPMLGEPTLRLRARKLRGRISVPVLLDEGRAYTDSFDIARRADEIGEGPSLFPERHLPEIRAWNDRSQNALAAGRVLFFRRIAGDDEALYETMPPFIPSAIRPALRPVARLGLAYLTRKYAAADAFDRAERTVVDALVALREGLKGRAHLFDDFSYADVTSAVMLQFVAPVDERFIRLGPASRRVWTHRELRDRFADLVEWRDALYAKQRRRATSAREATTKR